MRNHPTMSEVAKVAGVSVATVDRVLNSRLPVREGTAERVIIAAQKIGYHAAELMRRRLRDQAPVRKLGFCLQKSGDVFYQSLAAALDHAAITCRDAQCSAVISFMDELAPLIIAEKILELGKQVDALAVVALDHPHVTAAIAELHAQGTPVFTLLSDVSSPLRKEYMGTDNRQVGRTAGLLFSRMTAEPGDVAIFVGSHRYMGQEMREINFRSYMREYAPEFRLLDAYSNLDDQQLSYEAVLEMMSTQRNLAGIYVAGGGGTGVIRALREELGSKSAITGNAATTPEKPSRKRPTVIVNELTLDSRAALIDGIVDIVIDTHVVRLAQHTVQAMLEALDGDIRPVPSPTTSPHAGHGHFSVAPTFDIYTAENC